MQTSKKKPNKILIIIGAILSIYLGYLVGGAWKPGRQFAEFMAIFSKVLDHPFRWYFNENTARCILFVLIIYAMIIIMYYTSQRNLMPGKEFGTATFADVKQVNQTLADRDPCYNRILSKHLKMSLNTRLTKLNNNVLIIGGSGAGKTFYEVKPNIMHMPHNCSFIVTDPKGGAGRSVVKSYGTVSAEFQNLIFE